MIYTQEMLSKQVAIQVAQIFGGTPSSSSGSKGQAEYTSGRHTVSPDALLSAMGVSIEE